MHNKFEEFYYEDDRNYPSDVYWELYDKNHKEAIKKYEGHMFCPLCRMAPLTVAKGNVRRYFKVDKSNMDKHDVECSYRRCKGGKKEVEKFYKDLDTTDIRGRLVSCMNRMLKKQIRPGGAEIVKIRSKNKKKNGFLDFETDEKVIKYLPHKNFNSKDLEDEIDVQKIYYGKCSLYIFKFVPKNEDEVRAYYLKVLNQSTKKQICEITISSAVFKYLQDELLKIPESKSEAQDYYLCFSGILETGRYSYKCKLWDSRLIVLEKE